MPVSIRFKAVVFFFLMIFFIAFLRLVLLAFSGQTARDSGLLPARRGIILDSADRQLAFSVKRYSTYLNLKKLSACSPEKSEEITRAAQHVLQISNTDFSAMLRSPRPAVLLKRGCSEEEYRAAAAIDREIMFFDSGYMRYYPHNRLLCHVLGFAGFDNIGLAGLENYYDDLLISTPQKPNTLDLKISINAELQLMAESKLFSYLQSTRAAGGTVIIQLAKSGKIIALANAPAFSLNNFEKENSAWFRNAAVSEYIEPGSLFKVFLLALLLEKGLVERNQHFHCSGQYACANGEIIRCAQAHGSINLEDAVRFSCNTVMIKACEKLSVQEIHEWLASLGFGRKTGIDLPGEIKGVLPHPRDWGIRTRATIPIGQGIGATPLQLINAFTALVNGGSLFTPRLAEIIDGGKSIPAGNIPRPVKICTDKTSRELRRYLAAGVDEQATGRLAALRETEVGGKTGTAQRVNLKDGGYYTDRYDSVFLGTFPVKDPAVSILVILKDPRGRYHGGTAAAPLFAELTRTVLDIYRIARNELVLYNKNLPDHKRQIIQDGSMPDVHGMSLRNAMTVISSLAMKYHAVMDISGSGYVKHQKPAPGTAPADNMKIFLQLEEP